MKHFSLSGYSSLGAVFLGRLVPLVVLAFAPELSAGVKISELKDRLRVEVDGKLFTEWRHKEWTQPYLYPIIGPNGETVTRHYPIRKGVPNERPDHPHHHRDVSAELDSVSVARLDRVIGRVHRSGHPSSSVGALGVIV